MANWKDFEKEDENLRINSHHFVVVVAVKEKSFSVTQDLVETLFVCIECKQDKWTWNWARWSWMNEHDRECTCNDNAHTHTCRERKSVRKSEDENLLPKSLWLGICLKRIIIYNKIKLEINYVIYLCVPVHALIFLSISRTECAMAWCVCVCVCGWCTTLARVKMKSGDA